jgi:hypothetical protein
MVEGVQKSKRSKSLRGPELGRWEIAKSFAPFNLFDICDLFDPFDHFDSSTPWTFSFFQPET